MFKRKLHKALALLASLLILCSVLPISALLSAGADAEGNLVVNGDFENGKNGWSCNSGTAEIVSDANGGSSALQLTNPNSYGEAAVQTVNVTANTDYTLVWYAKRVSGTGAFNVIPMNPSNWTNIELKGQQNWMNETSGNWVKYELKFNTGAATQVFLKITAEKANAGSIIIDDIVMTKVGGDNNDQPPVAVEVVNGDFETGDATGWETYNDTAVKAEALYSGSYGMHLMGDGTWNGIAFQNIPVESGKEYTISMQLKTIAGGVNIQIVDGGTSGNKVAGQWFNSTDWTPLQFVVVPTTDTLCINFCGAGTGLKDSVYLDDVIMTVKGGDDDNNDAPAVNLLANGDFETGDTTGWDNLWGSNTVSVVEGHDSTYAMNVISGKWTHVRQKVAVETDTDYIITGWYKDVNKMTLLIKDGADVANLHQIALTDGVSEWTQVVYEFNSGSNTELLISLMGNEDGAQGTFDDFSLVRKNPYSNLLANGDFETGDASGWENLWDKNTITMVEGHNSTNAMNVISGQWTHVRQKVAVEADTDYVITGWYKDVNKMAVLIKDGADTANLQQVALADGTADWTQFVLEFNSGSNTELIFSLMGNEAGACGIFDDLCLAKKKADEPVEPSEELIVNGDFETGDTTGWENLWDNNTITMAAGHNSTNAMSVVAGKWTHVRQKVTVEPNTDYVITGWYKEVNEMTLVIKDGNDTKNLHQFGFTNGTTEWTQFAIEFNSGNETSLIVSLMGNEAGPQKGIFDDISLSKKKPVEPSSELIANGDFETGDTTGWENLWDKNTIEMVEGRESVYAMSVLAAQWSHVRQTVTVEANTDYVITGWYKDVNKMAVVVKTGDDSKNLHQISLTDGTAEWTQFTLQFNSGDQTSLIITMMGNEDGAKGIFDDISLTKAGDEPIAPPEPEYPPIEENQLKNGGFEEGETGWGWVAPTKLDNTNAFQGNNSAYLDNEKQYGEALTQRVPLRPNTDYVIIFYTKRDSGSKAWNLFLMDASTIDSGSPVNIKFVKSKSTNWFQQPAKDGWVKTELEFNSGEIAEAMFKFGPGEDNAGTFWLDNVGLYVKGYEPKEEPEPEGKSSMSLTSYGVVNNRPISADKNLLQNGDFESTGGQWDVDTFHTEYVSVVADSTAKTGSNTLFFNTSALDDKDKFVQPTFWLELQPNTDYVFSAWLKGALLSEDNCGRATIGIVDVNGKFLESRDILFLDGTRQLVPTAWDDEWHLRSVQFNTGTDPEKETITVGIALSGWGSKLWIDDMALFVVGDGTKYMSANMAGGIKLDYSFDRNTIGCDDANSLIPDPNMKKADESGFWAGSYGWRNGFVSFVENRYEYGASMKYTSTGDNADTYMIKWVDVEPNTQYTFAVDIKILEDGFGRLGLLDDKLRDKVEFFKVSFDSYDYDDSENTGWRTVVTSFNTDVYGRIGIAIVDGGGEVLLDNMRLFKTADAKYVEDYYIPPPAVKDDFSADDEANDVTDEDTEAEEEVVKKVKKKVKTGPSGIDPMIWVWIGAGSAVALAGAAVVIILLINKRKKAAAAAAAAAAETADPTPDASAE